MRVPNFLHADDIQRNMSMTKIEGYDFVAKPLGFHGLFLRRRLYLSWCIFIGKYDVVFFEQDRKEMK